MKKILLALLLISTNLFAQEIKSFVSADGTEIFYEDIGEGETIVLLQSVGFTDNPVLVSNIAEFGDLKFT